MMEFLGDVKCVANRLRQVISERIKCHPEACPQEGNGREVVVQKAKVLLYGGILIKEENRLAQERSVMSQSVAFSTARKYTNNAEQKSIIRDWWNIGSGDFKKRRAEQMEMAAEEIAGVDLEEVQKRREKEKGPWGAEKKREK